MEPLFKSTNVNLDWDGEAEIKTINSYKKIDCSFSSENRMKGITESFNAGDYMVSNGTVSWGVTSKDFEEKYKVLSATVRENAPADDAVYCDDEPNEEKK